MLKNGKQDSEEGEVGYNYDTTLNYENVMEVLNIIEDKYAIRAIKHMVFNVKKKGLEELYHKMIDNSPLKNHKYDITSDLIKWKIGLQGLYKCIKSSKEFKKKKKDHELIKFMEHGTKYRVAV